ncbi:heat-shock protein Hsp20 [Halobacteriales archaeon QH_10_67_22]|nr:MAG: heat-shock protein Hsp20 [Halobacteriales archaeon QH_10_67_22]
MARSSDLFEDIEELLDVVTGGLEPTGAGLPVDVADTGESFVVVADLPGHDREDISVTLPDDTTLAVDAERDTSHDDAGRYVTRERSSDAVSRRVGLPDPVEEGETSASYEDGVLSVTLPKRSGGNDTEIPVE